MQRMFETMLLEEEIRRKSAEKLVDDLYIKIAKLEQTINHQKVLIKVLQDQIESENKNIKKV